MKTKIDPWKIIPRTSLMKAAEKIGDKMRYDNDPTINQIIDILNSKDRFLILSHINPDGDGIGSQLALGRVLKSLGKTVELVCTHPVPRELLFLPFADQIRSGPIEIPNETVAVILDTPSIERINKNDPPFQLKQSPYTVNIDHHISNSGYARYNWIDSRASCVGEMLYYLFKHGGFDIDREVATCLYASILTDTGGFRYSNTSADTFEAAAELVKKGADVSEIANKIYSNLPIAKYRLLNLALETLQLHRDGRIGVMKVTQSMLKQSGASPMDSDGFSNYPCTIKGVLIAALLVELKDRAAVKASLRSKSEQDNVNTIARKLATPLLPAALLREQ